MKSVSEQLQSFFARSRLPVLFAGAGVSSKAGLPAWSSYLTMLGAATFGFDEYTKYMIDRAVHDGALTDAATYYLMCCQMPEATRLAELTKPLEKFNADELGSLVQLPFHSVVTTNFDRALFAAYAKFAGEAVQEVNIDDPTLDGAPFLTERYIARLHGREEVPGSMRLSTIHFAGLEVNSSYRHLLEHIFTRRQVLFVLGWTMVLLDGAIKTRSRWFWARIARRILARPSRNIPIAWRYSGPMKA